ncbi:MAG: hypothetical protein COU68_02515, partial [Candidatus Pacebacteria bacterium CG10_big_fil_rev_8_21_14_0_10_45_6]
MGFPGYYNAEDVGKRYAPRLALVSEEASTANLTLSANDKIRSVLVMIDMQQDFVMPEIKDDKERVIQAAGSLKVEGAVDDVRRLIEFIYYCPDQISSIVLTLDQHIPWQIFFSRWWKKRDGTSPIPFTPITSEAVQAKDFRPLLEKNWSLDYPVKLEQTSQAPLFIWPDHCMIGTDGAALVPALAEAVHWLSITRGIQPIYLFKGTVPKTEHYGPFCPCVEVTNNPQGGLNTIMLDQIAKNDRILFAGEAEDFCVHEGMVQVLDYFGKLHPDALKKIQFLTDCTSMVFPDNRQAADDFLQ